MADQSREIDRRGFLSDGVRVVGAAGFCGMAGFLAGRRGRDEDLVWQLDPDKCIACTNCQTHCVLDISAVKAVQCFPLCANCDKCPGYLVDTKELTTAAENQRCPTAHRVSKQIEPL